MSPNLIHWSSLSLRQGVLLVLSALLLRPEAARAEIVFSGEKNIAITTNFDGVFINIRDGQSGSESAVSGWDLNPFFGGLFIANSPNFQPLRSGVGCEDAIVRLAATSVIGGSSTFSSDYGLSGAEEGQGHLGTNPTQFADGKAGYMGFKLLSGAGAPVYGWMSVVLTENGNNGMIRSWAYENDSTIGWIKVGATGEARQRVVSGESAPVTASTAGDSILMEAGGKLTFQEVGQQGSFSGKIEGAGEIVIDGAGLRLDGINTFSGTASVLEGSKLTVTINDNLGGALVKLGTASELVFDSNAANNGTANKFTNDISLDGNGATLRNSGDGVVELAGAIDGSGDLIKDGAGDMKLTGNSTYTGNTIVNDGKLVVNGSISTSVLTVVNEGGALGGSGSTGSLTVNAGAVITPGNSPGNLQVDGDFTLHGEYMWELAALSTANPGTNYDTVTINLGNADITGASLNLSLGAYAPSDIAFWQTDQVWEGIINNVGTGTLTGFFASINNRSWSSLGYFSTVNIGNDVNLVWTVIPETHTALLGSLGMLVLLGRRSRDKSRGF
ncbi:MAG: autotransporter-associated beta strand repeat-containing protein [Verrucomicrobiota bacterium]